MGALICAVCQEEVRWGARDGILGYLHRETVDHVPIFGRRWTAEDAARSDAELDRERTRTKDDGTEETYTARRYSLKGEAAKAYDASNMLETEIPEPEVAQHDVAPDSFPPRSGIRQIINLIIKTDGWTLVNITASRGPYLGSSGEVLSISDAVVVRAHGPMVDNGQKMAVASWRDGAFDFAYTGILKDGVVTTTAANSMALKAWIKENPPP